MCAVLKIKFKMVCCEPEVIKAPENSFIKIPVCRKLKGNRVFVMVGYFTSMALLSV